jgi:hypothetical protein
MVHDVASVSPKCVAMVHVPLARPKYLAWHQSVSIASIRMEAVEACKAPAAGTASKSLQDERLRRANDDGYARPPKACAWNVSLDPD